MVPLHMGDELCSLFTAMYKVIEQVIGPAQCRGICTLNFDIGAGTGGGGGGGGGEQSLVHCSHAPLCQLPFELFFHWICKIL